MKVISDLQLHSKYSRAVSQEMVIPKIWQWGRRKGIGLIATGDWTHPLWMREIKSNLEELGNGLLALKTSNEIGGNFQTEDGPLFLLETEVSCIYSQGGKLRRIHILIWAPSVTAADKINKELMQRGANLISDGRPIMGLTSIQVAEVVFSIEPTCLVIPAHAWTPWFSLYGSESGFDSIDECFGSFSKNIFAVETGLSSDPAMNWRIKELDTRSIVSFSDAHSGPKLGREATVFNLAELSYSAIREAIMTVGNTTQISKSTNHISGIMYKESKEDNDTLHPKKDIPNTISYTLEFYPEEGKYHYTGHRNCGVKQSPSETKQKGTICPVCGRKLTVGVMHRVEQLAGRSEEDLKITKKLMPNMHMSVIGSETFPNRPPYVMLVPLQEILAEAIGSMPTSQSVQNEYKKLTDNFDGEFEILLKTKIEDITKVSGPRVAEGIQKIRDGNIVVDPGYDGVFGKVKIWGDEKKEEKKKEQLSLF